MAELQKLEGTPNSPVLVFSNSLGSDMGMWDGVVPLLLPYFRVLRYNTGVQKNTPSGQLDIADLGREVLALLDEYSLEKAHFCGLSMGGLIGQWLAINHPERINKLIIANSAAKIGHADGWNERIANVQANGLQPLAEPSMIRWFSAAFRASHPAVVEAAKAMLLSGDADVYARCCAAIRDADFREQVVQIKASTLITTGTEDQVTTVEHARFLQQNIPNAQFVLTEANHLSAMEIPDLFAQMLVDFLVGKTTYERGMHVRRTVLGDAHVDNANSKTNVFNADFQHFISHYAWGEIWTRPGLPKHHRSLITLSMMIALNRSAEFKMHVRAAINNGVTVDELKELILQSGVYCGLPAANEAYHAAQAVLVDMGIEF